MRVNPFDVKTIFLAQHAQHVVLIHFPIALFLSGVAFDAVQWKKRRGGSEISSANRVVANSHFSDD